MTMTDHHNPGRVEGTASQSLLFAKAARAVSDIVRNFDPAYRLTVPAFRSPPRDPQVTRSIRRGSDYATISISLRNRHPMAWIGDMIEGVVAAHEHLANEERRDVRALLWQEIGDLADELEERHEWR